ncbi:NACHT domain-containing protein [Streptomyces longwoodensis]|uniref:NACHT domain-containing protein n=1 Tax=Streptomyces longwoodensis TaxID=68231 RepID=UPI0036E81530
MGLDDEDEQFSDALIYQVKFRESTPLGTPTADELYSWVTKNISRELPKIAALRIRGAKEYIFITNVAASGHPGGGLRDRMQEWASQHLPLPTRFWWRDDLDVRVTKNPHIAFRFMLFDGPSSVAAYFERTLPGAFATHGNEHISVSRKSPAVSALLMYLGAQYDSESVLRFKQADLDSTPLLDFFVDVPASPRSVHRSGIEERLRQVFIQVAERAYYAKAEADIARRPFFYGLDSDGIGAAELLLHGGAFTEMKKVVLEGAPGQGKSTLTQFVGQVHRALILSRTEEIAKLPASYSVVDVKLPFRIELRRLATWLQGRSPWTHKQRGSQHGEASMPTSLEAFIVDHVQHVTEGLTFSVDDLIAIVSDTPTLLLLDGLDEVADTHLREQVVKCCENFIKRLTTVGADIQVVVTSRPIAFAKSPAFTPEEYSYFGLGDLSVELIQQYTSAWIKIRAVPDDQATELRIILEESLGQSHVADLARNPMQLAILIWLVYVKGWSLPDKRTALYEQYMSTFLDREADKSAVVRQHRDVLMQLHGYLGWVLHARSEVGNAQDAAGDVAEEELKELLKSYLEEQTRPTDLIDQLFHGVERVFVLVARIQGRFEFEVQPLREFFAARYLYKTSPHSTSAFPACGTRPERLEALIRNPYWLNVARFFCGWYDEGELADLSRRIEDLCGDSQYRRTGHPSRLVWRLLGDYVTTASPRDTKQLVAFLCTPLNYRLLLNESEVAQTMRARAQKVLPADAGLSNLIEQAQTIVASDGPDELIYESAMVIGTQGNRKERFDWWCSHLQSSNHAPEEWFRRGQMSSVFAGVSVREIVDKLEPASFNSDMWRTFAAGSRLDVAVKDTFWVSEYMSALGSGILAATPRQRVVSNPLILLSRTVSNLMRPEHVEGYYGTGNFNWDKTLGGELPQTQEEVRALRKLATELSSQVHYSLTMSRVHAYTEAVRGTFGNCWAAWRIALLASRFAGTRSTLEYAFTDDNTPMTERVAVAWRLRSSVDFWREALSSPKPDGANLAALAILLEVADLELIGSVRDLVRARWSELESWQIEALNLHVAPSRFRPRQSRSKVSLEDLAGQWSDFPGGFTALLRPRVKATDVPELISAVSAGSTDERSVPYVAAFMVSASLKWMAFRANWQNYLDVVHANYPVASYSVMRQWAATTQQELSRHANRFTSGIVHKILDSPQSWPAELISAAESVNTERVTKSITSLASVASENRWFERR